MKILYNLLAVGIVLMVISCQSNTSKKAKSEDQSQETESNSADKLHLSPVEQSPVFQDASLEMLEPLSEQIINDSVVRFSFRVENYKLGTQTADADLKMCANSGQGQHIHLILNNEPYSAHYEADFDKKLKNNHYVALSFLSRSYHESLKHKSAYVLSQFTVGDAPKQWVDLSQPHLFYSRPKGVYKGKDTEKVLLDFYLVNTALSETGNRVKATINGDTFIITEWRPYFMEGLPMGENTIQLELQDQNGKLIEGPYNKVERTFTLVHV